MMSFMYSWVKDCEKVVCYVDLGITNGMLASINTMGNLYPDIQIEERRIL